MTTWRIVRCTSGQEGRAERYLERMGYPHGWHPIRKVRISEAVYQRLLSGWKRLGKKATSRKPDRYRKKPYVHGYVFIPAEKIEPYRINGHHPGFWMEVLCVDGRPYELTDANMAQMKEVPDRVKELVEAAERAAHAAWLAKRPVVGGTAKITSGAFEGKSGQVVSINQGQVQIDVGALLGMIKVDETKVERVA